LDSIEQGGVHEKGMQREEERIPEAEAGKTRKALDINWQID